MTPAALLAEAGRALYGEHFNTALAAALGVNERTVRRWLAGDGEPGNWVWRDIAHLCADRGRVLHDIETEARSRPTMQGGG